MKQKIGLGLLWIGLIGYAFGLAPPDQPNTFELIQNLSTGQWQGINPAVIALFNIMGIWPLIYGCLVFSDGKMQRVPAWPFAIASFAVGAFALLPYLALRQPNSDWQGANNWFLRLNDSRWLGAFISLGALILVAWGLVAGDWSDFAHQWQTSRFIHVMSLDFCCLHLLFPILLKDDMARRGFTNSAIFWWVVLLPCLGPAFYLVLRPPLPSLADPVPG